MWTWLFAYCISYAVFCGPAYVAGHWLKSCLALTQPSVPLAGSVVVATAGYVNVWLYFLNPSLGIVASTIVLFIACVSMWWIVRDGAWKNVEVRSPFLLAFAVGLFYLGIYYLPGDIGGSRFFVVRPPDNVLPQIFAGHLYSGTGLRELVVGWHGSDRPPLQSGIQLFTQPLARALGLRQEFFQTAGTTAQLTWIFAFWALCARARVSFQGRVVTLTLATFSGYFLYNSVFIWPKLIAAALSIAFVLFLWDGLARRSRALIIFAAAAGATAYLSHGGSAFYLIPLGLVVGTTFGRGNLTSLAAAGVVAFALVLPWSLYQRFYDPPGDLLLKMHIAGVFTAGPPGALTVIREQYAMTSLATIMSNKISNVQMAFLGGGISDAASAAEPLTLINIWRMHEREYIFEALSWANLGWCVGLWLLLSRRPLIGSLRYAGLLIGSCVVSLIFWSLVTWGPNETVVTHSAYAVDVVLFVALGLLLADGPGWLAASAIFLQCADFLVVWVVGSASDATQKSRLIDLPTFAIIVVSAIIIMLVFWNMITTGEQAAADSDSAEHRTAIMKG